MNEISFFSPDESSTTIHLPFLTVDAAKAKFEQNMNLEILEKVSSELEVKTEDKAKIALSMALQARKLDKTLESSRVEITRPHLDYQRAINKIVKDVQKKLDDIQSSLQFKIERWVIEQSKNPFTEIDCLEVHDGTFYSVSKMDFEIKEEGKLPREYLMPDESAIKDAIKNGVRNIPGVEILEYKQSQMRIKN